jgi:hypothetical protein
MAKTAAQAAAKWTASTAQGEQTWADNLQATTKPIVGAAIAARSRMQSAFQTATAPGGVWETRLSAVGDAGIKAAALAKKNNYTTGVQQGASKFNSAIQKIIAYENAGMAGLNAIPKGGLGQSKARAAYWIDYMAAGRGTLGAS